jgi:hypothetical protein
MFYTFYSYIEFQDYAKTVGRKRNQTRCDNK